MNSLSMSRKQSNGMSYVDGVSLLEQVLITFSMILIPAGTLATSLHVNVDWSSSLSLALRLSSADRCIVTPNIDRFLHAASYYGIAIKTVFFWLP